MSIEHRWYAHSSCLEARANSGQDLSLIKDKSASLQFSLAEIYASAAEAVSGLTFDFESKFEILAQTATSVIEQVTDLGSDGTLQVDSILLVLV